MESFRTPREFKCTPGDETFSYTGARKINSVRLSEIIIEQFIFANNMARVHGGERTLEPTCAHWQRACTMDVQNVHQCAL